jgi:hypothetical protein
MVLPVFALLLAVGLWAIAVGGSQVRCIDAARDAARAVARGESDSAAVTAARLAAPPGAQVTVTHEGQTVVVGVSARIGLGKGALASIPAPTVTASATAQLEPSSAGDVPGGFP